MHEEAAAAAAPVPFSGVFLTDETASVAARTALREHTLFLLSASNLRRDAWLRLRLLAAPAGATAAPPAVPLAALLSCRRIAAPARVLAGGARAAAAALEAAAAAALSTCEDLKVFSSGVPPSLYVALAGRAAAAAAVDSTAPDATVSARTVYVDAVPRLASCDSLRSAFETAYGPVARVTLPRHARSGSHKCFAFIEFVDETSSRAAVADGGASALRRLDSALGRMSVTGATADSAVGQAAAAPLRVVSEAAWVAAKAAAAAVRAAAATPTPTAPGAPSAAVAGCLVRLAGIPVGGAFGATFDSLRQLICAGGRPRYIDCPLLHAAPRVDAEEGGGGDDAMRGSRARRRKRARSGGRGRGVSSGEEALGADADAACASPPSRRSLSVRDPMFRHPASVSRSRAASEAAVPAPAAAAAARVMALPSANNADAAYIADLFAESAADEADNSAASAPPRKRARASSGDAVLQPPLLLPPPPPPPPAGGSASRRRTRRDGDDSGGGDGGAGDTADPFGVAVGGGGGLGESGCGGDDGGGDELGGVVAAAVGGSLLVDATVRFLSAADARAFLDFAAELGDGLRLCGHRLSATLLAGDEADEYWARVGAEQQRRRLEAAPAPRV